MSEQEVDLQAFIANYFRPYDSEHDTYRRPPFAQPVKAGKNSAIYNAHSYHTKVPPIGIVPYIEHYTDPGDLLLDPFCGTGMTGVAALITGRHAILSDLSPAAIHIARNYCTPVDVEVLKREFERIKAAIKEEFDWLYGTTCDYCGGPATIQYTLWSDVFECGRCGDEIVLWNVAVDKDRGKVFETFSCPKCGKEQKKLGLKRLPPVPVVTSYQCRCDCCVDWRKRNRKQKHKVVECGCLCCRTGRAQHPTTRDEVQRASEIAAQIIPYWTPETEFDPNGPQYRRNALSSRDIKRVVDLYTKRNLWALSSLWNQTMHVKDTIVSERLRFALTAIMVVSSRRNRWPQQAPLSGTIYIPSLSIEMNVGEQFQRRMKLVIEASRRISDKSCIKTVKSSATKLDLPDACIDYIFTDPPFGSSIYYSEVNLPWEAWIGELTDTEEEAVVHRSQDGGTKRLADYTGLMIEAFREMFRVLKPGRWASVVFHNSDDSVWQIILQAAEMAGFERADINAFNKEQLTFKGIKGAKGEELVTNQDIVLNLRRPKPVEASRPNGRTHLAEAEQRVVERVADFLATNPPPEHRTLQHLWNQVLFDMIRDGSVEVSMAGVAEMLAYHYKTFKLVDSHYYLRGEAVIGGNVFDLSSDSGAIAWLGAILSNEPLTTGDLIPRWQQETAQFGGATPGRLEQLLEQNFWLDQRTGEWRLPTRGEREKMSARADLSAQAHLRVIHRFLAGTLDRHPNDQELAAWIRFCYSREFFDEADKLFQHLNRTALDPQEYKEVKRMAAASRIRAGAKY